MDQQIDRLIDSYEQGRVDRRGFIAALAGLFTAATDVQAAPGGQTSLFEAVNVNHIALRVPDVQRSADFYRQTLGLRGNASSSSAFLYGGTDFVALFRGSEPGLDHFAFSVKGFDREQARQTLRDAGIEPIIEGPRTYFRDPDGIKLQLEAPR